MRKRSRTSICRILFTTICSLLFVISVNGCTKKPDVDQLRNDIQKKLEKYRGRTATGNADIYRLIHLEKTNGISKDKNHYVLEYKGEVECIKSFYIYADSSYSFKKATGAWGALVKGFLKEGTRIGFTGSMNYELTENGWTRGRNSTSMDTKYAPHL